MKTEISSERGNRMPSPRIWVFWGVLILSSVIFSQRGFAQVAAPSLSTFKGGTTANPAAMQWGGASFIGGAVAEGSVTLLDTNGDEVAAGDYSAQLVRLRAAGDSITLAIDAGSVELSLAPVGDSPFSSTVEADFNTVGLAIQLGDSITIGAGREQVTSDLSAATDVPLFSASFSGTSQQESTLVLGGLSLKFGEVFFIGVARGTEQIATQNDFLYAGSPSSQNFEVERDVTRYGVALYSRDAAGDGFHLEARREEREAYDEPEFSGGTVPKNEIEINAAVLEFAYGGFVLSLERESKEVYDDGVLAEETDTDTVIIGWEPREGLSLTFSRIVSNTNNLDGLLAGTTQEAILNAVQITLNF